MSIWHHFLLAWSTISFSICFIVDPVEKNLLAFAYWEFCWEFFISPSFLFIIFTGYRILDWLFFTFTLKVSFSHLFSFLFCFWWEYCCYFWRESDLWLLVCNVPFSLWIPLQLFIILLFIPICTDLAQGQPCRSLDIFLNLYITPVSMSWKNEFRIFFPPCCFCMVYKRRKGKILI